MGINVDGIEIADARISNVALNQMIGSYELIFHLSLKIHDDIDVIRRASIIGSQVTLKSERGESKKLGFSRPQQPLDIVCKPSITRSTHNLHLLLQPAQLVAIEEFRSAEDLRFELLARGTGTGNQGEVPVEANWSTVIPRSDWIEKLKSASAQYTILLEVPLLVETNPENESSWASELQRAEAQFRNGEYRECISLCRKVIDELGHWRFGKNDWYTHPLNRLASGQRKDMSKEERESALCATIRHYTHLAHHGSSEGGASAYTRAEAQFVLTLAATMAARLMNSI